jgi:hypothetical protein
MLKSAYKKIRRDKKDKNETDQKGGGHKPSPPGNMEERMNELDIDGQAKDKEKMEYPVYSKGEGLIRNG